VWEDVVDGSEGDHDHDQGEGEGEGGGVEAVGPVDDQAHAPVESQNHGSAAPRLLVACQQLQRADSTDLDSDVLNLKTPDVHPEPATQQSRKPYDTRTKVESKA
jgi:hypothetical protein